MTTDSQPLGISATGLPQGLQELAAAAAAYLVHRRAHEERVWRLRASAAVFFLSLTLSTVLTNWVSRSHRVGAKPTRIDAINCGGTSAMTSGRMPFFCEG